MALVNTLRVNLEALVGPFVSGMQKAGASLDSFISKNKTVGDVIGNVVKAVKGMNPAVAGTVAVVGLATGAITKAVQSAVALGDELNTVSQRTGVSVESLSQLKFIAEQNNSSFGELQVGLRFLARNIGAVGQGSDHATKAFKALGVEVKNADGSLKSTDQVLSDVADGLKNTESSAVRLRLAMQLLGPGAITIVPLFAQGSEAIAAQRKEADALGATISTQFVRQADEFGDNLNKLKTIQQGLGIQIAQALVPSLNNLMLTLIPLAKTAIPATATAINAVTYTVVQSVAAWNVYAGVIEKITGSIIGNADAWDKGQAKYKDGLRVLSMNREEWLANQKAMLDAIPVMEETAEAVGGVTTALEELASAFDETLQGEQRIQKIVSLGQSFIELGIAGRENLESLIDRLTKLSATSEEARRALNLLQVQQEEAMARELAGMGQGPQRTVGPQQGPGGLIGADILGEEAQAVPELVADVDDLTVAWILAQEATERYFSSTASAAEVIGQTVGAFGNQLEDGLVSAAMGGKVAFGDMFKDLLRQIARAIIRALILKAVLGFFGGGLGSISKAITGALGGQLASQGQQLPGEAGILGQTALARSLGSLGGGAAAVVAAPAPVLTPQVIIREATPRTWVEITDKHIVNRLTQRKRELNTGEEF